MTDLTIQPGPIFEEAWYKETLALARELHAGQVDKAGRPKAAHVERVARLVVEMFPDATREDAMAALLHDVFEDTDVSADELGARGIPHSVLMTLLLLTHAKEEVPYLEYIRLIAWGGGISALRVKLADNVDNLDPNRPGFPGRDKLRQEKYLPARAILRQGLSFYNMKRLIPVAEMRRQDPTL